MPRLEFRNATEMASWLRELGKEKKYLGYMTDNQELVLIPRTSTAPILYGIVECVSKDQCKEFLTLTDIKVIPIKCITWNSESTPITV